MGGTYYEERLTCVACPTSLVVEYAPDADGRPNSIAVTCVTCQHTFDVALPRPASVFIVRRSGDTPVFQRRLRAT